MKNIALILVTLLLIGAVAVAIVLGLQLKGLKEQTQQAQVEAKAVVTDYQAKLDKAEQVNSQQVSDLVTSKGQIKDLKADNAKIKQEFQDASSRALEYQDDYKSLICTRTIVGMDYKNILNASIKLQAYMTGDPGVKQVSLTMRNSLWDNAKTKVHVIRYTDPKGDVYSKQFIVYFDEYGFRPSVFSIDGQCWVNAP
jgi:hypothetical protein